MIADLTNPAEVEKWNLVWWQKHTSDGDMLTGEVPFDRVLPGNGHGLGRIKWCPLPISKVIRVACDTQAGLDRLLKGDYSASSTTPLPPERPVKVVPVAAPVVEDDFDFIGDEPVAPVVDVPVDDDDDWIT